MSPNRPLCIVINVASDRTKAIRSAYLAMAQSCAENIRAVSIPKTEPARMIIAISVVKPVVLLR